MSEYTKLELLGSRKWALKQAEQCFKNQPIKSIEDERALSGIRAELRKVNKEIKQEVARVQLSLF